MIQLILTPYKFNSIYINYKFNSIHIKFNSINTQIHYSKNSLFYQKDSNIPLPLRNLGIKCHLPTVAILLLAGYSFHSWCGFLQPAQHHHHLAAPSQHERDPTCPSRDRRLAQELVGHFASSALAHSNAIAPRG